MSLSRRGRNTKQRKLIMEAVQSRCDHPSADDIFISVRKQDKKISKGTVYRNLNILAETGSICHVRVPSADRYDSRTDMHYHMFCASCGVVVDAPIPYNEKYDKLAEEISGFRIDRHRTVFEGLCADCRKKYEEQDTNNK